MKKKILFFLLSIFWMQWIGLYAIELQNLKVEYTTCPIGLDVSVPRFSWMMAAGEKEYGVRQTAYRLQVFDEDNVCVWDSGETSSDQSLNIEYAGEPLKPETRYRWELQAWTQEGKSLSAASWFETGLMAQNDTDVRWKGAQWIGGGNDDMVLYSHYLPVFTLNYVFHLNKQFASRKTAFFYGANDERLMDANKNMFGIANVKNSSYIKIEIDASLLSDGGNACVKVYRVGFCPTDCPQTPLATFIIPNAVWNQANVEQEHTLSLNSNLGTTQFFFDNMTRPIGEINLNPLGQGGDFIAFPVLGDVGINRQAGESPAVVRMEIRNFRSPGNLLTTLYPSTFETQAVSSDSICWINPSQNAVPMLRTVFRTQSKKITKARLYVTARGIYDFYINGTRVGDDYFNPGVTQYNKTHLYQTFDVTSYLKNGENAAGAILSEGWWSGGCTFTGENWNYFGDRQSLLARLAITYEDGTVDNVVTCPESWKLFNNGPVIYGSFFQGEVYDARREQQVKGWNTALYDDSGWKMAQIVSLEGNISTVGDANSPRVDDYSHYSLTGQFGPTVKAIKELCAQSVEEVRPGVFVYDMGQNMAGVPRIALTGCCPGQIINLRFAEVKYPNLPRYAGHEGMLMLENIRAAMAQDIYIARGGDEVIAPRFTFHGYRYVEITGIDQALPLEAVRATVLSSVDHLNSYYETSNPLVNRLWKNIVWSTRSNFLSIPTDCPQRNERLGWAGDIQVFSRTATYLTDASQFLRRYLRAMRDVQRADGRFPDIAPLGGGFGGMLWGSAGITIPWECYLQYQDEVLLKEHYPAMKRYIRYLLNDCIDPKTGLLDQGGKWWGNLGDWLGLEDLRNDASLLWEAYLIYDLDVMQRIATLLGYEDDALYYSQLHVLRSDFFIRTYLDPSTGKTRFFSDGKEVDTQTSYVLPLAFDIVPDSLRSTITSNLLRSIIRTNTTDTGRSCPPYSLMTGFIGTAWINLALSNQGCNEAAYRLLQQTTYPSWLYSVEQGATTIWERLNSYTHIDGFGDNNRMNSFNHYSFGAVGAWMYTCSLGIQPDAHYPGFKHFFLKPAFDPTGQMTYAHGYYDSMYGRIESGWEVHSKSVGYTFTIPANTSATLCLPATGFTQVKMNGAQLHAGTDFQLVEGLLQLELGSGTYNIEIFFNESPLRIFAKDSI